MTTLFDTPEDLQVAGGPVRLYRAGESGPPLLLLHGAMLDTARGVWRDVAPALAARYRVHLIDLPRHGGSRPWSGRLDDDFYQRFLLELLDALELERVAVVGLSLGGGLGTGLALRHPERVSALVAVGPGGIGARRPAQLLTWATIRLPGAMRFLTWVLARFPGLIRRSVVDNLVSGDRTPGVEETIALAVEEARAKQSHREGALDDWQIDAYGPFAMRVDHLPALPAMSVPTLWVRGDRDRLVGHAEMAAAEAATPGSRLVTMPDAGHIVTYDQPAAFTDLVVDFLASALADEAAEGRIAPEDGAPG